MSDINVAIEENIIETKITQPVINVTFTNLGERGIGITNIVDNGDGTLTISWEDGVVTTSSFMGPEGPVGPVGPTGPRIFEMKIVDDNTDLTTGDGKLIFCIPQDLNGYNLISANAYCTAVSSSGLPTIQIRNVTDSVDMLSTEITIDENENTSYTALTPSVVDVTKDGVSTGDLLAVDVDVAGTGVKGLGVILLFEPS